MVAPGRISRRSLIYETFDLIGQVMGVPDRTTGLKDYNLRAKAIDKLIGLSYPKQRAIVIR
ncbi:MULTISPECIES: hypothetical protein [Arthrospira]|nr:hypothetical protein [Arthrospira platensis]KDR55418.1 hypothetical protein APPUASWS_022685 [Arthrospira platensis str. Paraca]MBD2670207.1 hypothetical protein [Arthrospira platensis FACHB-439]MBD2710877.1 hypothetical protein [Arthrospira platensis FACHB-835]MDF2211378.1 hypothetical protein [Arthrospira platensis NCB002]MDT9183381.1 hypothetical protein [Limnospira sp. PMC 289.06]MDT9295354.1 hypothetical protein [Arthrospira platensis PCC 7345]MDT9311108.1 hypothetical protein [Limnos